MKQRIISTLAALICFAVGSAGNIFVEDIVLKPGETKEMKISLSSAVSEMVGVQFDVTLPDGFTLENNSEGNVYKLSSNQAGDLTCNISDLGSGTYRFVLYSNSLQKLKEGELMSLNLKVNSTKDLANYSLSINNVAFSDKDGKVTKESSSVNATVKVTNFFTLFYKVDGVEYKTIEVEYGAKITAEAEPTKEGYTFSGWSEIPATMPAKDVTVTGSFSINKYKLIYKVDGEEYKSYQIEYGASITAEEEPTKEGYTFSGWSEIPETMPAKDVTVTGSFSINKYKLIYKVDDVEYKTIEVDYGANITAEAEPTKDGYTFSGWSEIPGTMPAKDVTVTGTFNINKYKIIYIVDGKEYQTAEVEYGTELNPIDEPTKEGYSFSGWSEIPSTMPAKDVIVIGSFSKNNNTLVGDVNNDGTVDISDYIGVANHILGNSPEGFNEKAADVNNDGSIDISDYIGVANIILTGKP